MPASKTPKRVSADALMSASPLTAAPTRCPPSSSAPSPPATASRSLQRSIAPGRPSCRGSTVTGSMRLSMYFIAVTSPTTPSTARARAGPVCATGVVTIASPDAARLAELTKTKGRSRWAAFHVGFAVSESGTAV